MPEVLKNYHAQLVLIKVLGTQQLFWYGWLIFSIGQATGAIGHRHIKEYSGVK
jgi:hypothetical protein